MENKGIIMKYKKIRRKKYRNLQEKEECYEQ